MRPAVARARAGRMGIAGVGFRGYPGLAAATIQLAVRDLKHGSPKLRHQTRLEILGGGLEPWMDLMAESYDVHEQLQARVGELLRMHDT